MTDETVLMDGQLLHHGDIFQCYLTTSTLSLTRVSTNSKEATVYLQMIDVLGSQLDQRRPGGFVIEKCPSLDLFINRKEAYSFIDELSFICVESTEEKKLEAARYWVAALSAALRSQHYERGQMVLPRRYKVIVNPTAGIGHSVEIVRLLRPLLQRANIILDVTLTLMPGHARDIARVFSPLLNEAAPPIPAIAYDALVIVGGDGTVQEVINGCLGRKDWPRAVAVPLAIVPTGSSNMIATSLGIRDLTSATYALIKGVPIAFDIMAMVRNSMRAFLPTAFSWGAINELPLKSTPFSALFQLLAKMKNYPGKIYYRPVQTPDQVAPIVISPESEAAAAMPPSFSNVPIHPDDPNGHDDELDKYGHENHSVVSDEKQAYRTMANAEEDEIDEIMSRNGQYGPVTPTFTEKDFVNHEKWKSFTGNFAAVVLSNTVTEINGIPTSPEASPFDGLLDLFVLKDATQMQLTRVMMSIASNTNPSNSLPNVIACTVDAIVLTPASENARTQAPQLTSLPQNYNTDFVDDPTISLHLLPKLFQILRTPLL